jgi:hypothetical protein
VRSAQRKIDTHRKAASPSEKVRFAIGEIVSMEYDDLNPDRYEPGVFIGLVVKRQGDRMKVVYADETGETDIAWLTRHNNTVLNRWIDNTFAAIVSVEEASVSQREAFQRWVPLDRQVQIIERER